MKNQKNITDRKQLKTFFRKGSLPDESAFEKLIDSTFNKADDKLDITDDGLMIYPSDNDQKKLLNFYENKDDSSAKWVVYISEKKDGGIYFSEISELKQNNPEDNENDEPPVLYLQKETGNIGIGTNLPLQKLDIQGYIASQGRVGNHREGDLKADGEWHNVFGPEGLTGCNAFEIMAYAKGDENDGKYSLLHAIAVSTYGKPKITKTCAYYGLWWNKIAIRWESKPSRIEDLNDGGKRKIFDFAKWWKQFKSLFEARDLSKYNLQLKTKSYYGDNNKIHFTVTVLWDNKFI